MTDNSITIYEGLARLRAVGYRPEYDDKTGVIRVVYQNSEIEVIETDKKHVDASIIKKTQMKRRTM